MKVDEIMTREVLTIGPDAELRDVAAILAERHISGLPVCDAQRRVVGVVSEGDILFKEQGLLEEHPGLFERRRRAERGRKARAVTVRDAMTTPPITVSPSCSVAEAAGLMGDQHVNRLPVVRGDELVGIVTRTDLVRAFVRSDAEIRREIEYDVLVRTLWLEPPSAVEVQVERGAVRLTGQLDTRSEALMLERLVERVPGVVSVEPALTWAIDDTTRRGQRELRSSFVHAGRA